MQETEFGGGHEIPSEPLPSTATTDWRRFTSNFVNPPPGGPGGPDAGKRWREGLGDLDAKQDTLEGQRSVQHAVYTVGVACALPIAVCR